MQIRKQPRVRLWRVIALATLVWYGAVTGIACDRNKLSSGPRLTLRSDSGGDPGPGPGPGPGDCPAPLTGAAFKGKINEVMPQNNGVYPDELGRFLPWVEIFNNSDVELNLGGVAFSDDLLAPKKWKVPCIEAARIPPRGFLIIVLDGDSADDNDLHANWALKSSGTVTLVLNGGSDLFTFDMGKLSADESAGRYPDGAAGVARLSEPSPGAPNEKPLAPPVDKEGAFLRGDANQDARVNITDMTFTLKVLFQSAPLPSCRDRLDTNDDGAVNVADVLYVGQALFQRGPRIPPPYPQAGTDPTQDDLQCPP